MRDTIVSKEDIHEALVIRHSEEVQKRLEAGRVAIAGLGGLGSNVAFALTRIGVGHLHLVVVEHVGMHEIHPLSILPTLRPCPLSALRFLATTIRRLSQQAQSEET